MKSYKILLLATLLAGCNEGAFGVSSGGTFIVAVGDERFRVRIDNALLATKARDMMARPSEQQIINGELARGDGGFNTGYGWHMKPNTVQFSEATIAGCDGLPSAVQSNIDHWVDTVKRYCPWGGRFVSEIGRSL